MAGAALPGRLTWRVATLKQSIRETPRVVSLLFDVDRWPGHVPGQHVDVRLTAEDGYQAERSYSIASAPEEPGLALTVEGLHDGEVSSYLVNEMRAGDQIEVRGPIGGYFVWRATQAEPLLLVGGGSGVVPLMSMIRHRISWGRSVRTTLLYSSRSWDDVIYRDELQRVSEKDAALDVIHTLTRIQPEGWKGYKRRVDAPMLREVLPGPVERTRAYVCGPTRFVENVSRDLVALGLSPGQVFTERFGPT